MKKCSFMLLVALVFAACTQLDKSSQTAILTGKIDNAESDFAVLRYQKTADTSFFDADGLFRFSINLKEGDYYSFSHGRENTVLYLQPGDSVYLTLNPEEFDESIVYSGLGSEKNNYLAQRYLKDEELRSNNQQIWLLPADSFLMEVEANHVVMQALLDSYNTLSKFQLDFLNSEKARLTLGNAIEKMKYPQYHQFYTKETNVELPDDYYAFVADIDITNKDYRKLNEFTSYFDYLVEYKAMQLVENDKTIANRGHSRTLARLKVLPGLISDQEELNKALYKTMAEHVAYSDINNIDSLVQDFKLLCKDSVSIANIDSTLKSWESLAAGMPAPDFSCVDLDGKEYKLSGFLGKYVYLDIWATWCGPCLREIPELEKMHEEYADKNIAIISISIDDTPEPWRKMVTEDNMAGLQMYANGAWKSDVAVLYKVRSIPRFILIDTEGMIINVRAERPSGDIRKVFESYGI
ncbi:MAG: TlpA family protein disulfide reductase [Bacteroidales bacterium]|nr:TlpA family protein disulfide reductase [Bacteroidales bacterium]MCF8454890.1 TlpA family protein disulfide reductase [Bacteroidales bacterium]